jgi:hypothetical protein
LEFSPVCLAASPLCAGFSNVELPVQPTEGRARQSPARRLVINRFEEDQLLQHQVSASSGGGFETNESHPLFLRRARSDAPYLGARVGRVSPLRAAWSSSVSRESNSSRIEQTHPRAAVLKQTNLTRCSFGAHGVTRPTSARTGFVSPLRAAWSSDVSWRECHFERCLRCFHVLKLLLTRIVAWLRIAPLVQRTNSDGVRKTDCP